MTDSDERFVIDSDNILAFPTELLFLLAIQSPGGFTKEGLFLIGATAQLSMADPNWVLSDPPDPHDRLTMDTETAVLAELDNRDLRAEYEAYYQQHKAALKELADGLEEGERHPRPGGPSNGRQPPGHH